MDPQIIERNKILLAGIINCGQDVGDIDISGLWNIYGKNEQRIPNRIDGKWYELHIGSEMGEGIYKVLAGIEIQALAELPVEICVTTIPSGTYAHFRHSLKDGGYDAAFAKVERWVKESGTDTADFGLQCFGEDFDPASVDSEFDIYIPLR